MALVLRSSEFLERKYLHSDAGSTFPTAVQVRTPSEQRVDRQQTNIWDGSTALFTQEKPDTEDAEEQRIYNLFETDRKAFWCEVAQLLSGVGLLGSASNSKVRKKVIEELCWGDKIGTGLFSALEHKKREKLTKDYLKMLGFAAKYTPNNTPEVALMKIRLKMTDKELNWMLDLLKYLNEQLTPWQEKNPLATSRPDDYGLGLEGLEGCSDKALPGTYVTVTKDECLRGHTDKAIKGLGLYMISGALPAKDPSQNRCGPGAYYENIRDKAADISFSILAWLEIILVMSMRGWEKLKPQSKTPLVAVPADEKGKKTVPAGREGPRMELRPIGDLKKTREGNKFSSREWMAYWKSFTHIPIKKG